MEHQRIREQINLDAGDGRNVSFLHDFPVTLSGWLEDYTAMEMTLLLRLGVTRMYQKQYNHIVETLTVPCEPHQIANHFEQGQWRPFLNDDNGAIMNAAQELSRMSPDQREQTMRAADSLAHMNSDAYTVTQRIEGEQLNTVSFQDNAPAPVVTQPVSQLPSLPPQTMSNPPEWKDTPIGTHGVSNLAPAYPLEDMNPAQDFPQPLATGAINLDPPLVSANPNSTASPAPGTLDAVQQPKPEQIMQDPLVNPPSGGTRIGFLRATMAQRSLTTEETIEYQELVRANQVANAAGLKVSKSIVESNRPLVTNPRASRQADARDQTRIPGM